MAPKNSSTAKKPSTGSRRSARLEMRGPRAPIDAPTECDLSISSEDGGEKQGAREISAAPQSEPVAATPFAAAPEVAAAMTKRIQDLLASFTVRTPGQMAKLTVDKRIELTRALLLLIREMRMYGMAASDIQQCLRDTGLFDEGRLQKFGEMSTTQDENRKVKKVDLPVDLPVGPSSQATRKRTMKMLAPKSTQPGQNKRKLAQLLGRNTNESDKQASESSLASKSEIDEIIQNIVRTTTIEDEIATHMEQQEKEKEETLQNVAEGEAQQEAVSGGERTENGRPQKMDIDAGTTDDTSSKTASDFLSQDTEILSSDSSARTRKEFTNAGTQTEEEIDGSTNTELLREILHEQKRMQQLTMDMWASLRVEFDEMRREMSSCNSLAFTEMEHVSKKMENMRASIDQKIDQLPKFALVRLPSDLVPPSSQAPSLSTPAPNLSK